MKTHTYNTAAQWYDAWTMQWGRVDEVCVCVCVCVWQCWLEAILLLHWTFILDSFLSHIAEVVKSIWDLRFLQDGLLWLLTSCRWCSPRNTAALPRIKLLYNFCRHTYAGATCSSEMSVHLYLIARHHNCNDSNVRVPDKFKIVKLSSHTQHLVEWHQWYKH